MNRPALVPELYVSNLGASLSFYLDLLGFHVEYDRPEERFAYLALGSAHLMLEEAPDLGRASAEQFRGGQWRTADLEHPFGRGMNLEIRVEAIDAIQLRLVQAGHPLLLELHERIYRVRSEDYAVRRLLVADPDGYLIRLSEPLVEAPSE
jgi:catechol 2,3-dioxygenase-like lactoylglutathione lyase family enzyme